MSHSIKVSDGVYITLEAIRGKRETFSQVVERLIRVYASLKDVSETLGPSHYLKERPREEVEQ